MIYQDISNISFDILGFSRKCDNRLPYVSALKLLLVHQITRMISSKWIIDWNRGEQSAKELSGRTIQQFYVNLIKTLVTNVITSRLWVSVLIIHWSCFKTNFDWRTFFVTRCCWYFPTFWHSYSFVQKWHQNCWRQHKFFINICYKYTFAKFDDSRVKISQVTFFFISFQILHLEIEQQGISLVNFDKTADVGIVLYPLMQFFYFYCIMQHSVCLLSEKKRSATLIFNPWLSVLTKFAYFKDISRTCRIYDDAIKNLMTSQGIYLHYSNPIILKIPCAKFHASSWSQAKVKVGGGSFSTTQKRGSKNPLGVGLSSSMDIKRYVDDIFPLFLSKKHIQIFADYMNK